MMSDARMPPLQVTVKEAARILGYSERTIYRLLDRRALRRAGRGRLLRVDYASVEELHRRQLSESEVR